MEWDINKFVKWLMEQGVGYEIANAIALEVSDILHHERIRAINDFKERMVEMWKTDYYKPFKK